MPLRLSRWRNLLGGGGGHCTWVLLQPATADLCGHFLNSSRGLSSHLLVPVHGLQMVCGMHSDVSGAPLPSSCPGGGDRGLGHLGARHLCVRAVDSRRQNSLCLSSLAPWRRRAPNAPSGEGPSDSAGEALLGRFLRGEPVWELTPCLFI